MKKAIFTIMLATALFSCKKNSSKCGTVVASTNSIWQQNHHNLTVKYPDGSTEVVDVNFETHIYKVGDEFCK